MEEPLLESAPLARRLARRLCRADAATGETCAWLHGIWQYLRLLGLASTPALHAEFFLPALKSVVGGREAPRVLISGAADYSMLALVLEACRDLGTPAAVTVVDQCETPLAINRWYAERAGLEIATRHGDIFGYSEPASYDAVCTHSFLSELPPEKRSLLFGRWRELLRPGGAAIIVNRIRPAGGLGPARATPAQVRIFGAAVLEQARAIGPGLSCDPLELAREAEAYMRQRIVYAVPREEITRLLESAGFAIQSLSCGPATAVVRQEVTGPTTPGGADYARVVARKT